MTTQTNETVTDPTKVRTAIAARMKEQYDIRQAAENERVRQVNEAARVKAEKDALERVEKAAKEAQAREQLRHLTLQEILQLARLPRITFTASYHFGGIVADFAIEESYVIGQGNGSTVSLGLEMLAGLAIGMPDGKWSRASLQSVIEMSAKAGKASRYPITDTAKETVVWGRFVDYFGLTFESIEYPDAVLDEAVEQDMRRRFITLLEPNSR